MAASVGLTHRQQQTTTMSPEHLMGKAVLKMSLQEVQQFTEEQFAQNPALVVEETAVCPVCGCTLSGGFCLSCGSLESDAEESPNVDDDDWQQVVDISHEYSDDEFYEPFARVASSKSLAEHLKEQIRLSFSEADINVAELLVDYLDEDGYLREPLIEIANRLALSVPQLESILQDLQHLDPPGVAARSLQECLLLQLARLDNDDSPERALAMTIVEAHWEGLSKMKLDRIANTLQVNYEDVVEALAFLREHTTPHPSSLFRDPWEHMSPRRISRTAPDVVIHCIKGDLVAEIPDPVSGTISIEEMYAELYAEMSGKKNGHAESDREHVRECVGKAQALIEALEFRKTTLRRLIDEILCAQPDFFLKGPAALKPMTKKDLAARVDLHESTVCRATQDKTIRLPNGEVISFDLLFDSALPIKELVRELAAQKLSDGQIADRLSESGIQIARRTVAKYRDQLGVLPVEYRIV